ncbi:MAG TPA: hypothetical protein VIT44_15715 [Cyclobacteriaceae bacterium]
MIKSKTILTAALLMLFISPVFAQTKAKAATPASKEKDCYGEWYSLFRERGAQAIVDGTHEVIISIRKEGYSQCFMGKVAVAGGKLKFPVYVAKDDGSFETLAETGLRLDPASEGAKNPDAITTITDGMSVTAYTTDQESVKLFFYKFINDKPKKNKVAPPVSSLVKL